MAREIHVAKGGCDLGLGTAAEPYETISKAAREALPGDVVVIHEGTYREWVDPARGGNSEHERIRYQAAPGEQVCIKGSEVVQDWESAGEGVWRTSVPNALFGDFNPFAEWCWGDWMIDPPVPTRHLGDVYLDGRSLYEAASLEEVRAPEVRTTGFGVKWVGGSEPMRHPEETTRVWYAEVGRDETTIWANFQGADPREHLVEVSARMCCFYPRVPGRDFITVSGLELCQAATPFAPPTADQPGIIGPHWSYGWVIEDCHVHDAKCAGVSLGKDASTGHNEFSSGHRRPGYNYQFEVVCRALRAGWSKETVGSHVVRRCHIHDCGQNGVVGHLGCAFSTIEDCDIHDIATKHEYYGYEIAGIKLHAAVDTQILHNNIHDCTLGIWLDWEACGTRVSRNVFHHNDRDLMVEVTHGPCTVDNNVLGSPYAIDNVAQGTAFVHNLVLGCMRMHRVVNRSTPYHFPHSTDMMGSAFVFGGDDRWYNNVLVGGAPILSDEGANGLARYNGHPSSWEGYLELIEANFPGDHDHDIYPKTPQAVYIHNNVYLRGSEPYEGELDNVVLPDVDPRARVVEDEQGTWLEMELPAAALEAGCALVSTCALGLTRTADAAFEAPDGSPITFDVDLVGERRAGTVVPGPVQALASGSRVRVW